MSSETKTEVAELHNKLGAALTFILAAAGFATVISFVILWRHGGLLPLFSMIATGTVAYVCVRAMSHHDALRKPPKKAAIKDPIVV